jgi:hypothetical protein
MAHLGKVNLKPLSKQKARLSMKRNIGKEGFISKEEFYSNWDRIFKKKDDTEDKED